MVGIVPIIQMKVIPAAVCLMTPIMIVMISPQCGDRDDDYVDDDWIESEE